MKILCIGDAMIAGESFGASAAGLDAEVISGDWESDPQRLQHRRLLVEQDGPGVEGVPDLFAEHADAEIVLGLFCPLSAAGMDALADLRVVGVARAGLENVDVEAATERGIAVLHIRGRNAEAVSDFAAGLILAAARNIARAHAAILAGGWPKSFANSAHLPELSGRTLGIVGYGLIGRLLARKMSGFAMRRIAYDPFAQPGAGEDVELVTLPELLESSDFVSLHARLDAGNHHLIGAPELELMQPTAYLVNTARAGLVDAEALTAALRERRIAGAALDVFDTEPLQPDNPLLELDNVTLTSHIAGTTTDALTRSPQLLVATLTALLRGETGEIALANPEVLDDPRCERWLRSAAPALLGDAAGPENGT